MNAMGLLVSVVLIAAALLSVVAVMYFVATEKPEHEDSAHEPNATSTNGDGEAKA